MPARFVVAYANTLFIESELRQLHGAPHPHVFESFQSMVMPRARRDKNQCEWSIPWIKWRGFYWCCGQRSPRNGSCWNSTTIAWDSHCRNC
ncbi:hypothetical protein V6N12_026793 [Hibiscus sabdariffa]|uniref:Uncharacterized protein n=1 Tax=Hibiscus sabdariffa TaxID=183260 RepID=A0ABR2DUI1_9ROSI